MKRRTKIVCTLGPAVDSRTKIKGLIDAGMNVARINCSHGDWDTRRKWIGWLRELSSDIAPIGILVDLQGPKFRIGAVPDGAIQIRAGQRLTVGPDPGATIPISQREILEAMQPANRLLLGDGDVELKIGSKTGNNFSARARSSGLVKSRQGVTLMGKVFDTPCITPKDLEDLVEAVKAGVDMVALSYVQCANDVADLRWIVDELDKTVGICAKIETRHAIQNLEDILEVVDVVMVARGDMGLQMHIDDVPIAQKMIISKCLAAGKPVITATQMLESMMHSPRPTRAESTDVANAILDGTDAVMLSGETASGEYPAECVRTMVRLAHKAEPLLDRKRIEQRLQAVGHKSHTEAVAFAVNELAKIIKPKAIITTTTSGQTARLVSKFRPAAPILCATWDERTSRKMAVVWGVESIIVPHATTTEANVENSMAGFVKKGRLKAGDHVIITAGVPMGVPGHTNLILTQYVK